MAGAIVVCVDGSDLSARAVRAGLDLLGPGRDVVVATVIDPSDPTLVTGVGMAGGTMSPDEFEVDERARRAAGELVVQEAAAALAVEGAGTQVLEGDTASALCRFAEDVGAAAIVIGTRGRGGVRRALLGSVSDQVVRNAPCPVVITGADGD